MDQQKVHQLRAIEALRAGVPNRDVVRSLPPHQSDVEERFEKLLDVSLDDATKTKTPSGLLLEGDFGTGKSHWLERLNHLALEHNFICSRIVLNKETPLHDLKKIYRAAVEAAYMPGKSGPALIEIANTYSADKVPGYAPFFEWLQDNKELDPRYAATLHLFERTADEGLQQKIIADWTGYPMTVRDLKAALKDFGETAYGKGSSGRNYMSVPLAVSGETSFKITRPSQTQLLQRFEFMTRFFRSAGYAGWILLLDEAEMISKYSLRQRGKAYAHLAQLMGIDNTASVPGLATVFTITKDYSGQVLNGRKNDIVNVPAKMEGTREDAYVVPAQLGMNAIQRQGIDLRPPNKEDVEAIYEKVRLLYSQVYDWPAPDLENRREYSLSTGLRQYLRLWINTWDLRRLYDYEADTVIETMELSYDEDIDLQSSPEEPARDESDEPFVTL